MPPLRVAALCLCAALAACGPAARRPGDVATARERLDGGLCDDVYTLLRPPGGRFDRVRAHRLAPCDAADPKAPVVLYLPGMHMNGGPARAGARPDLARDLAASGVRVWSVDYRTHAVPADTTAEALRDLASWTADVFAGDVEMLGAIARTVDPGPFYVAGFSFGAGLAYRLAATDHPMEGLVVLDGVPPEPRGEPDAGGPAIDVGGSRLPYADRRALLAAVLADPGSPSPVPGFASAGAALTEIVDSARAFGGHGGLSGVKDGRTDVRALAALLAGYDRWWPRAALAGGAVTPARTLRVLAFATANMGPAWVARVRAGARAFGGDAAAVHELPGWGHVDVLIARDAARMVFEPIRRFVQGQADPR